MGVAAVPVGFGAHHETEAVAGALPVGQNSPQKTPFGLYAEQFSATAFTAPRAQNLRSWLYRLRPSAMHPAFRRIDDGLLRTGAVPRGGRAARTGCAGRRWRCRRRRRISSPGWPRSRPTATRACRPGSACTSTAANQSMARVFASFDGELLLVPQQGALAIATEFGHLAVAPGEIAVIPRGVKFRVAVDGPVARLRRARTTARRCGSRSWGRSAPTASPIARDFLAPVAAYEDRDEPHGSGREVRRAAVGGRRSTTRRSTSSPGTATSIRTSTTSPASTRSTR